MNNQIVTWKRRLASIIIDLFIIFVLIFPFVLMLFFISSVTYKAFILSLTYSLFLCKDFIDYTSLGKYKNNLEIISIGNTKLSPLKLILRNIFIVIWPLELIMYFLNPERRIGDIMLSTKIIYNENKNKIIIKKQYYFLFPALLLILFLALSFLMNVLLNFSVIKLLFV